MLLYLVRLCTFAVVSTQNPEAGIGLVCALRTWSVENSRAVTFLVLSAHFVKFRLTYRILRPRQEPFQSQNQVHEFQIQPKILHETKK